MKAIWGITLVICVGLVGIGILNMTGQAEAELTVSVPEDASAEDRELIARAKEVLMSHCPHMAANAASFSPSRTASEVRRPGGDFNWMIVGERFGWTEEVDIWVNIANNDDVPPPALRKGVRSGNFRYIVGFGGEEGIWFSDDTATIMCSDDTPLAGTKGTFVPVRTSEG